MEGGDTSKLPAVARIPWFKEFLTYDPLKFMRKVRQPVLILQGELDRQVTADQATLLDQAARESGNKNVTLRIFPKLNHLFLPATTGAVSEYQTLTTTVVPKDVLETLAAWSAKTLRAGK
jgi:fermentation-respiration switch protein FrsA (DUF1100 family)